MKNLFLHITLMFCFCGLSFSQEKLEVEGNGKMENVILTNTATRTISVEPQTDNSADGKTLMILAGNTFDNGGSGAARAGGSLILGAGDGHNSSQSFAGGHVTIRSGANHLFAGQGARNGGDIIFQIGGPSNTFLEKMRIIENGNIGIGTASPSAALDVVGTTELNGNTSILGDIGIGTTSPSAKLDVVGETELNGNTSILGDIGIGTTSPGVKLDVLSSDASRDILNSRATWTAGANSDKAAVVGINDVDAGFGFGVFGAGGRVGIQGNSVNVGIQANDPTTMGAKGVLGYGASNGVGGKTSANGGIGVMGESKIVGGSDNIAVFGEASGSTSGNVGGFFKTSGGASTNFGVLAEASGATTNIAGGFAGNVSISGTLAKGSGSFKIDHPLDPENKYLYHSFVESPDMMNVYNGNITTDGSGLAEVELPRYFMALNQDFRYQLTVIGTFAQAIIKEEISENRFVIQTNTPSVKVSWQITGIRKDPYAVKNRIQEEVDKAPNERGLYLHPEAYGQPKSKSIMGQFMETFKKQQDTNKKSESID